MDRRVQILQRGPSTDPTYGGLTDTWTVFATVWAQIHDLTGREVLAAGTTEAAKSVQITIRYLGGLSPGMRVFDITANRTLLISAPPSQSGRRMFHILQCTEINPVAESAA